MLADILEHTPLWVYAILAYVVFLGLRQSVDHRRTLRRATLMPLAMATLSLSGLQSSFAREPIALAAWAFGLVVVLAVARALRVWPTVRWLPEEQMVFVPGSWVPLVLMLGIFVVKFTLSVLLARHPSLASARHFVAVTGLAYGCFTGAFVSRGIAMWQVTRATWTSTPA